MKRLLACLVCVTLSTVSSADGVNAARKQAMGSMVVSGSIEVSPDGNVSQYSIDRSEKLPAAVAQVIAQTVPHWQFAPVTELGGRVAAKAAMSLRVVANPVADGKYAVSISGAEFGQEKLKSGDSLVSDHVSEKSIPNPFYPPDMVAEHVTGTVYVLLQIDRAGKVENATAQQVNLRVVASEREMRQYRKQLAAAATSALKRWTFNIPTTGKDAGKDSWSARVPVNFNIAGDHITAYGDWDVYIPGPLEPVPWIYNLPNVSNDKLLTENVDSTPAGGSIFSTGGLHLITKLNGG